MRAKKTVINKMTQLSNIVALDNDGTGDDKVGKGEGKEEEGAHSPRTKMTFAPLSFSSTISPPNPLLQSPPMLKPGKI